MVRSPGGCDPLSRPRLHRGCGGGGSASGAGRRKRNGHRHRQLVGTFGALTVSLPRVRLLDGDGGEKEWRSQTIQAYKRLTKRAEAIIANTYLAGTNTRRVRRALAGLFGGKVGKDAVSRAWRKVKTDWESWQARDLSGEDIVRLILDGTGVKARLDGRVLSIPLLVVLGVRRDGQKVLLAVKNMGGETEAAWRHCQRRSKICSAPGSLDTSLSHAAGLIEIAACHA